MYRDNWKFGLIVVLVPALLFGPALYFNDQIADALSSQLMRDYSARIEASRVSIRAPDETRQLAYAIPQNLVTTRSAVLAGRHE